MPCYGLLGIEICIPSIDDIVLGITAPVAAFISDAMTTLENTLRPLFDHVINSISPFFQTVIDGVTSFVSTLISGVQTVAGQIWGLVQNLPAQIIGVIDTLGASIVSGVSSLGSQISSGLDTAINLIGSTISTLGSELTIAVGGAIDTIGGGLNALGSEIMNVVYDAGEGLRLLFTVALNEVGGVIGSMFSGFGSVDVDGVINATIGSVSEFFGNIIALLQTFSPITPDEAASFIPDFNDKVFAAYTSLYATNVAAESVSLGQFDVCFQKAYGFPSTAAAIDVSTEFVAMPLREGIGPAYRRWILKNYQPNIPPYMDLISIYVKEGYLEDHWVELPAEMVDNFKELGFSEYWTKRLWGKHWEYPSATQLYEMLHRSSGTFPEIGVTTDVLRDMLKLHDFEPKWRGPLEAISWNTWRIYDIRTGWEMGILSDDALLKRLIDTGYEPKDATILLEIQKLFVLRSELDRLLAETDQDFIEGWISLEVLRANYAATPYRSDVQELRILRAINRRDREFKRDIRDALRDRYYKGDLTESEFSQELSRLDMVEGFIALEVERQNAKKLKKVAA